MHFRKHGKTYQLCLDTPEDLEHVLALDESLWVATSAPAGVFRCDPKFLEFVDSDHNGRIRTDEVREAVKWLLEMPIDRSRLMEETDTIPLSAVRSDNAASKTLIASTKYVLKIIGQEGSDAISLGQVRRFFADVQKQSLNGDGVIVPEAADSPETAQCIRDALACFGGAEDASGKKGITESQLEEFQKGVEEYLNWKAKSETAEGQEAQQVMTLGSETPGIYQVYQQHAREVDAFFAVCRAARFEPAAAQMSFPQVGAEGRGLTEPDVLNACLERLPLARPTKDGKLPLAEDSVNPLYRTWIRYLVETVLSPILNQTPKVLTEADWQQVKDTLGPYEAYLKEKKGAGVEKVPLAKLKSYRDGPSVEEVRKLIKKDKDVAVILETAHQVEKLLLYHKYLFRLTNNFVNFSQLYDIRKRALFESGSAVIDGRWFNMALRVENRGAHSAVAKSSNIFTFYLEVTGKHDNKEQTFCVAVPATSGTKGNLAVGKRGIFFDTEDREYDARIVQIIENPISLSEALASPFVRLRSFVVGKIEAISGTSEKDLQKTADGLMKAPQAAAKGGGMGPAALLVGLSVSAAAIGSAFAFVAKTLASMSVAGRLMSLTGAVLVVVVPVSLIAILKLAQQDISALLEGCGWGINATMRLTRQMRRQFTRRGPYPGGATGTPRGRRLKGILILAVLIIVALAVCYGVRMTKRKKTPTPAPTSVQAQGALERLVSTNIPAGTTNGPVTATQ